MIQYSQFVNQLSAHVNAYGKIPQRNWESESYRFIDGLAAEELRKLVDLGQRRKYGAFFTNTDLAYDLISNSKLILDEPCTIYDPAVGAGNLLIAAYKATLKNSNQVTLLGTDLHLEFIQSAKFRLEITGLLNIEKPSPIVDLMVADGLKNNHYYSTATHIITNPPFNLITGDKTIKWGSGKLSAAAIFIDRIIQFIKSGTTIIAILPDVLRSGSRYMKWRAFVSEHCTITDIKMLGQFDKHADVDVFSVVLTKKTKPENVINGHIWTTQALNTTVVEDLFDVSVGSVVDNRDKSEGPRRPFLVSKGLPGWKEIHHIDRTRQFNGKSIQSPFLVVKRTSRMGEGHRAIATIINSDTPVYVDNHLIVLQPKSGKLSDCHWLINKLASNATDEWINEQIRCRHLTVKITAKIPL